MVSRAAESVIHVVVLAVWLGAAVFFSAAVAPALFAALPSRTLAGDVVGRLLPAMFYSGMLIGAVVAGVAAVRHGGWRWRGPETFAAVMFGACAVAQFTVAPRIERLRVEIAGPIDALAADDARRIAFGRLHGISVGWLGVAMLAAAVALVMLARAAASQQR